MDLFAATPCFTEDNYVSYKANQALLQYDNKETTSESYFGLSKIS